MEVFRTEQFYIFVRNDSSLWWNRFKGNFTVKSAWDLSDTDDIECLGITEGIIGVVEHTTIYEPHLMIIKESTPVGQLYFHHTVHKIKSICFLNMGAVNQEIELPMCTKHGSQSGDKPGMKKGGSRLFESSAFLNKTVGAVRNVSNTIKSTTQQAATQVKQTVKKQKDPRMAERFEKRLTDELHKIFDDSDSFYYSRTVDLTNSLQRQYDIETILTEEKVENKTISDITRWWKHVDDRFFWNKHMLKDIIALGSPHCDNWILPIIQGYVQLAKIPLELKEANPLNTESLSGSATSDETFSLALISRRSRHQAGTRYNRRGIDPNGKVANYVETEQVLSIICSDCLHRASFVQIRGSVPIFWSQPDAKFRPPPRLDKTEEESHTAFRKHLDEQLERYKKVCIVNLIEQQGRERIMWNAFNNHVLRYNSENVIYSTFDFHEYCRGMRYENVTILINALAEDINAMRFCWRDDRGLICSQNGVFRVNCIDCLDRTNVVQTAIAKTVLELQLCRLGLAVPGSGLSSALKQAFLTLWADNGDIISRQYAGTKALKGDYTRTGERKLSGMMKDGVASANRYYLSTFKDALRQVAIDVMTGCTDTLPEKLMISDITSNISPTKEESPLASEAMASHVKSLIDDCKKLLVDNEPVLGAWGLIDADPVTGDPQETEMDTILLLTQDAYYVACYDDMSDRITEVKKVALRNITSVELGVRDLSGMALFAVRKPSTEPMYCFRINYTSDNEHGYFHMFRSTSLRFFNNVAVVINNKEEMVESLQSICESIMVARDVAKLTPVQFQNGVKFDKKGSKVGLNTSVSSSKSAYLNLAKLPNLTKNVAEKQLVDIRSAGSKALTNMSEQFSKFSAKAKPNLQLKFDQGTSKTKQIFTLNANKAQLNKKRHGGNTSDGLSSDYSSDDENRTNIFEPTLDNFENNQVYIGKDHKHIEPDLELIENPLYSSNIDPEPVNLDLNITYSTKTPVQQTKINPFDLPPKISVEEPKLNQKLSQSSNNLADPVPDEGASFYRCNSDYNVTLNIGQSHSESALRQFKNIASPVASTTKELLSPLSKIAKGVQNLGANFTGATTVRQAEQQQEDQKALQEKWRNCNTRLVAL